MCQVGPVNGRLKPVGEVASRPPLPSSSQIALSPKLSNRNRSPNDPRRPPALVKSPLKFPRPPSVRVVMALLLLAVRGYLLKTRVHANAGRASVDCTGRKGVSVDRSELPAVGMIAAHYSRTDFGMSGSRAAAVNLHDYTLLRKRWSLLTSGHAKHFADGQT